MDHSKMGHDQPGGHDHGAMIAGFLRRFWVCLALSAPVVAGSMMFQDLVGYRLTFPYSTPLLSALATAIYGYGGWPFLSGTVGELRARQDWYVKFALQNAAGVSEVASFGGFQKQY